MATTEAKRIPAIAANIVDNKLTLDFSNGKRIVADGGTLPDAIMGYAAMHGLKQKLVDAAAITCNPETGRPATIEDKYNAVKTVYDRLVSGAWNAVREGGATGGLLFRALCRLYDKKTPEQITEYLGKRTDAEKTALRQNPKIAAIIAELRAEAGTTANIDTDAMLGELE